MLLHKISIIFTVLILFSLSLFLNPTVRVDRYWANQVSDYLYQYPPQNITEMLRIPSAEERIVCICEALSLQMKYADEAFIQEIAQYTQDLNILQIKAFVTSIAQASKGKELDRKIYDEERDYIGSTKALQIPELIMPEPQPTLPDMHSEQKVIADDPKLNQYPLLKDVYHKKKEYFTDAAAQLKAGQFRKEFRQGILLYGKPGVGKGDIVEAIKNESGCEIIRVNASELIKRYQGTGSSAIKSAFAKAKAIDKNKGVIVFIDELQSLCPVTTKDNVEYAHKYEGRDYQNALSQIWAEFDECTREYKNILTITASNDFKLADERLRERFKCIYCPYPDAAGVTEILKNKALHFKVPITYADLKKYENKLKGMSSRKITTFIKDAKTYVSNGCTKEQALEKSYNDQLETIKDGKQKEPSTIKLAKKYSIKGAKIIATGALMYIGGAIVGPTLVAAGKVATTATMTKLGITSLSTAAILKAFTEVKLKPSDFIIE